MKNCLIMRKYQCKLLTLHKSNVQFAYDGCGVLWKTRNHAIIVVRIIEWRRVRERLYVKGVSRTFSHFIGQVNIKSTSSSRVCKFIFAFLHCSSKKYHSKEMCRRLRVHYWQKTFLTKKYFSKNWTRQIKVSLYFASKLLALLEECL